MRVFPSLAAALGLALGAAGVWLAGIDVSQDLPAATRVAAKAEAQPLRAEPLPRKGPWMFPVAKVAPVPVAAPPVVPPAPRVDTSSLAFLGKVVTEDQNTKYFFKERASGLVVGLVAGESKGGWTLSRVDDAGYHLQGPGGLYEIRR